MKLSEELKAVKEKGIAKSKWIEIVIEKAEEMEKQITKMRNCKNCNNYSLFKGCTIQDLHTCSRVGYDKYRMWEMRK